MGEEHADFEGGIDDEISVAPEFTGVFDRRRFLPTFSVPTKVTHSAAGETEEEVGVAIAIDVTGAVVRLLRSSGKDEGVLISGFLGHGHTHLLALHIGPRGVAGIHEHEIGILPVGIVSGVETGMVHVGGGNGIAASIVEPSIP